MCFPLHTGVQVALSVAKGGVVDEDIGAVSVTVTLTGNLKTDVIINIATVAGTGLRYWLFLWFLCSNFCIALANADFRPVDVDLIFNENTPKMQMVSIPILNDVCLEPDGEQFMVVASSDMDCVNITDDEVTITINDDDSRFSPVIS